MKSQGTVWRNKSWTA